jgi:hypothetical protein
MKEQSVLLNPFINIDNIKKEIDSGAEEEIAHPYFDCNEDVSLLYLREPIIYYHRSIQERSAYFNEEVLDNNTYIYINKNVVSNNIWFMTTLGV